MTRFVNWLGRWSKIADCVREAHVLEAAPIRNARRLDVLYRAIGAMVVTALHPTYGNDPCRWEDPGT